MMKDCFRLLTEEILNSHGIISMGRTMSPVLIYKTVAGDEISIRGIDEINTYLSLLLLSEDRNNKINKIIK